MRAIKRRVATFDIYQSFAVVFFSGGSNRIRNEYSVCRCYYTIEYTIDLLMFIKYYYK